MILIVGWTLLHFFPRAKLKFFLVGVLFGVSIFGYRVYLTESSIQKITEFNQLNNNSKWVLTPKKSIRKDIYLFSASSDSYPDLIFLLPIQLNNSNLLKIWECEKDAFKSQKIPSNHFIYPYVKRLGETKFYLNSINCKILQDYPSNQKVAEKKIRTWLESGNIDSPYKNIALALVLGNTDFLPNDIYKQARNSGTLHLFAASGLHIGIFIGSLFLIGKYLLRLGYYSSLIFPLAFAWLYLYILAFPVSLTRAFFFALVIVLAKLVFRKIAKLDLLIASATVIYIFREDSFLSVGFYLSFLAVFGIFFLKPRLDWLLFRANGSVTKTNLFQDNISLSLSANLATLPIAFIYFPGFSFGSLLCNIILVPYAGLLLPLLYLNLFLESILPNNLTQIIWIWTDLGLRLLVMMTDFLATHIGFYSEWNKENGMIFLSIFSLIVSIAFFLKISKKFILPTSILAGLVILSFFPVGYILNQQDNISESMGMQHISNDSFFYINNKTAAIGGYCKNDEKILRLKFHKLDCSSINKIYIDHDSCMQFALICKSENHSITIEMGSKYLQGWADKIPEFRWESVKKNSVFRDGEETIFFYKAGFDPPWLPKYISKHHKKGKLILQIPKMKKRKFANHKWTRKTLGLSNGWEILRIEDE
ncbi:MAG: ComEC/Rec2 family competence protein [Leptospira sp.]|nr:ComEC/Rec2 family competence protein [Leptospira sp.]